MRISLCTFAANGSITGLGAAGVFSGLGVVEKQLKQQAVLFYLAFSSVTMLFGSTCCVYGGFVLII